MLKRLLLLSIVWLITGPKAADERAAGQAQPQMPKWSQWQAVLPICLVLATWAFFMLAHEWFVRCSGSARLLVANKVVSCPEPLTAFSDYLTTAVNDFSSVQASLLLSSDVTMRLAWLSTFAAFFVIAVSVSVISICLMLFPLRDRLQAAFRHAWRQRRRLAPLIIVLSLALFAILLVRDFVVRRGAWIPFMSAALSDSTSLFWALNLARTAFMVLGVFATATVVALASSTLLPEEAPRVGAAAFERAAKDLATQWGRLRVALFAGAALLVSAVAHQAATYAWVPALAGAISESERAEIQRRGLRAEAIKLSDAAFQLTVSEDTLAWSDTSRFNTDYKEGVRAVLRSSKRAARESLAAVALDSLGSTERIQLLSAAVGRAEQLAASSVTRFGGLLYSFLLAAMYIPAAWILMQRARELSEEAPLKADQGNTAKTRRNWREDRAIEFTLSGQWARLLALLAPFLASGGALLLLKEFD